MKYLSFFFFILMSTLVAAQKFYDLSTIQKIEITFAESNWDALLDAQKAGADGYVKAQSVSINGEVFTNVGVKYKGNSTYKATQVKNPFHIELDAYQEQDYNGYTDIKLSNVANDPSFLREVLSYDILRKYMDAPDANYANVYVNGVLLGLYSNSEAIDKTFLKDKFGSKNNTFVKCNPPAGAGPQTTDFPSLVYKGTNSADYVNAYELKSDLGWDELINLCDILNNKFTNIESILDVDRALWMLAFNNVLVNLDSYSGSFAQNYYLYKDDTGRFLPIMWDFNESFGRFSQTGTSNLTTTASKQQMPHLLHATDVGYPLIKQLLSVPMYKRMYLAHMKTILLENFSNGAFYTKGLEMQTIIDAAVQADVNKFFTYSNFKSNITTDVSAAPGLTNLMNARSTYLLGLSDFTQTEPDITVITLANPSPLVNEQTTLRAAVSGATAVYIGYRNSKSEAFTRVQMFDDGAHDDGAAGDGVYGAKVNVTSTFVQYYAYAENNNAGIFSPRRAEHEYYTFTATSINPSLSGVVINEFMASNSTTARDQDGEYDDWIELYNNSSSAIDLSGYYLTDDATNLVKWTFPVGTTIGAKDYLIIWADNNTLQTGLHASFKLASDKESILLVNTLGVIVDEISYVDQKTDVSYGRFPNGTGSFQSLIATYKASNVSNTAVESVSIAKTNITAYPNPSLGSFQLVVNGDPQYRNVTVYSLAGTVVYQTKVFETNTINTSDWKSGMYLIKVGDSFLKIAVK